MSNRVMAIVLCIFLLLGASGAQVAAPPSRTQPSGITTAQPVSDLTSLLQQLQQAAQALNVDLARMRIEKWKADSDQKQRAQQNADSISRNITTALPAMIDQVRANPNSLASAFKLYRNVNALFDVVSGLTESTGAFGQKNEYQTLANDAANLDNVRRSMGEKIESLASLRDVEVQRLRSQVQAAAANTPPPPPKKIVVDDEEKPKKKVVKKKPAAKPATTQPATNQQGTQSKPQ